MRLSNRSIAHREGIDERLILLSDEAIKITVVDFGHPETGGLRPEEMQYGLYLDGKSRCDGAKLVSKHQLGKALDFYAFVDGHASWEEGHLAYVACAFMQVAIYQDIKIEWGGMWPWDKPHLELID